MENSKYNSGHLRDPLRQYRDSHRGLDVLPRIAMRPT
jgi:hypothetical protein